MAQTKEISINRALKELKTLESRIENAINKEFISTAKADQKTIKGRAKEDFLKDLKANYNSVVDLINYRNALKAAVIASNAVTEVKIGEEKMTVAEAINRKEAIREETSLLAMLKRQYATLLTKIDRNEEEVRVNFENFIEKIFKDKEANKDDIEKQREIYYKNYKLELQDPNNLKVVIEELEKKIDEFLDEVDACLTDSNAITIITIEW